MKDEMGWACSMNGEKGKAYRLVVGMLKERDHWEDEDVCGRIILIWILGKWDGGDVDWIGLAQDRNRWRALVNSVLNLRVP
jgi:hypothetical protein